MNIHLAGIESIVGRVNYSKPFKYDNWLTTFAYFCQSKRSQDSKVEKMFGEFPTGKILLDSGAFSKGSGVVDFEIEDYISFLHKHGHRFFRYINLDLTLYKNINELTIDDINHSIVQTDLNQKHLEREGLNPIPVYQRLWNNFSILEDLLDRYDYICVAGLASGVMVPSEVVKIFLDQVFELNAKYKKKIHGLGNTTDWVLKRYPFYSVDSTSWLQGTKSNTCHFNVYDKYKNITIDKSSFHKQIIDPNLFDGFNGLKSNYSKRLGHNINFNYTYQRILQSLWKERGVNWDNQIN